MHLPEVLEEKGIRVLTSKQLAEEYGTTTDRIKQNFKENRSRYIDGKHYISLTGDDLKAFKNKVRDSYPVSNNQVGKSYLVDGRASHLYLWTEKGALLHAKSLNTDKAWEVYDYLVDFYFRAKEKQEPEKKVKVQISTPNVRTVVNIPENTEAQKAITDIKKALGAVEIMLDESNRYLDQESFERYRGNVADAFLALMHKICCYQEIVPKQIQEYH